MARHQFAVLSLAAIALVSSFWFLLDVLSAATHTTTGFGVAQFEGRFGDFPRTVQPHSVYGYVSDTPPQNPSAPAELHLTQYVLAPAIVLPTAHQKLVIVNYHSKDLDPGLLRSNHLRPYRSIGADLELCLGDQR